MRTMKRCLMRVGFLVSVILLAASPAGFAHEQNISAANSNPLRFSPQPTAEEIGRARVFDEPILAIGTSPNAQENKALADAMSAYAVRTSFDDLSSFSGFRRRFPESAWTGSLLLHLGTEYYNYGYYSKALDAWEQAWQILKNSDDPKGKPQADRSLGELAKMYSRLGRMDQLSNLLASVAGRSLTGPGTQLAHTAQGALWMMQHRPGISFKCGPMALDSILSDQDVKKAGSPMILNARSTTNGIALSEVAELSKQLGMNYQMAFHSHGAPWITPAVVHWKVGHYAALLRQGDDRFLIKDHTFHSALWMSASALEEETSGYCLLPPGSLPKGWRAVAETEGETIRGKGILFYQCPNNTTPQDLKIGGNFCPLGMTTYTFNAMLVSLSLNDTPVGYHPPVGPSVYFQATYNQNETGQPATFSYANLGPEWNCNWLGFITDYPSSPGQNVSCYEPGGGTLTFTGYNPTNGTFAPETMTQGILTQTSVTNYQMQFGSGLVWVFGLPESATGGSRRIFLTQIIDAQSNSVSLTYDSDFRLVNITDAIGQTTTLSYTNSAFPSAITAVQDPFGRTASFEYNTNGLLSQITDVLGLASKYTYGSNDFITVLTTPYGATTFSSGVTNAVTWLEATDPLGESELAETSYGVGGAVLGAASDPQTTVPTNMEITPYNNYLNDGVTFFWGKQVAQLAAGSLVVARAYNFLFEGSDALEGGIVEAVKEPMENRVWYNYPGEQSNGYIVNPQAINKPSAVGRVLDDGFSQTRFYQYNALGLVTNSTDPLGRSFTYVYATNGVDLLQTIMTSNGKNEIQSTTTYNAAHRPLTITDASGQTTTNTYNARGQLLSTTDALGETTSFTYDTYGYLLSIIGPLQTTNDVTSFMYDAFGRVQTVTDTEGYTLTYAYDAMDRTTNITFPDGTTEQFVYSNLDLIASADRLGRWTTNAYNADRQLIQTEDPLGRITQYDYCSCGALEAIVDPAGNPTWWDHDVQSRVTAKHYADGSTISYTYENTTSRLHARSDEKGQQTVYQYYGDNNLQSVSCPNAIVATPTVSYTYDTNYNRILTMQDGIGTTVYTYNPITTNAGLGAGQLDSVDGPLPNSTVAYQYDVLDRVTNRAINGVAQTTAFDLLGRPTTVTNALGTFQYTYVGATPRLSSEAYPNGQTNLYSYYNNIGDQRLLQIKHLYPNGSLISGHGYAYNAVGDVTAWTNDWDTLPERVWLPKYDAADQLTNVVVVEGGDDVVTNYSYAYDLAANRTSVATNGVQSHFYYNPLNQIAGSSATFPNRSYEWDANNHLTAIIQGTSRTQFNYDGIGHLVQILQLTNGTVSTNTYYLWCKTKLCQVRDSTGSNIVRRVLPQGEVLIGVAGITNYFETRDHLHSIREATDTFGNLATRYDYDPYGQALSLTEEFPATLGFSGGLTDRNSGLIMRRFRALDTVLGRWLSRDPLMESESFNLYSYVGNSPISYVDEDGRQALQVVLGASVFVAIVDVVVNVVIPTITYQRCALASAQYDQWRLQYQLWEAEPIQPTACSANGTLWTPTSPPTLPADVEATAKACGALDSDDYDYPESPKFRGVRQGRSVILR